MRSSPSAPDFLARRPFAHRGLHGAGVVENSRAAFRAAIAGGHGIECDVQPSRDGVAFVFHDAHLDRLTRETGPIADRAADHLADILLRDTTDETIPTLAEILALVAGRAPVLVEVKAKGPLRPLCRAVARDLAAYSGEAAVMSFSPRVARWFARAQPDRARGLVVTAQDRPGRLWGVLRRLALRWSRAQFVAVDVRDLPSAFADRARRRGLPVLTWTVRTADARTIAAAHADQIIFEDRP